MMKRKLLKQMGVQKEGRNNPSCANYNDNSVNNTRSSNNIICTKYKVGGKDTKCNSSI